MYKFGVSSQSKLQTCHPLLQQLCHAVIHHVDITILEGFRGKDRQNYLRMVGQSKLSWPDSRHNGTMDPGFEGKELSDAVDIAPWPLDWKDTKRWIRVMSFVQGMAEGMGIPVRLGGDWNRNFKFDEQFFDWPHVEILPEAFET